ncbi:hypothetical protein K431DRAFT_295892 [Polychaeton citri CBS 116435]|uniref:Geranylgeranyl pyrophosphate synthetase n=1 Tax=Polychaeton citri CBS 116435 TaxID=1314669 RepID=A0A9P4Q4Y5_9PEZI|nr:hypothetical protein K431DRAFT_295892 [Polychaeton citri CBS 116435]
MYRGKRGRIEGQYGKVRAFDSRAPNRPPSPARGKLLETLVVGALGGDKIIDYGISGTQYVASYNWLEKDNSTILVPGLPPTWTPLKEPQKMKEDRGDYFRDPNAARAPIYPIAPAVQSLLAQDEEFPCQSIDLLACTSTLGNLLRYVRGAEKPFRFWVQIVGNTVFFIRHENSPAELIPDVKGFGHTFPETYTTWQWMVKGSVSHQRLLQYNLGGLKCIIRFQCDGYLPEKLNPSTCEAILNDSKNLQTQDNGVDQLLQNTIISSTRDPEKQTGLKVSKLGCTIPQDAIFELKTHSIRKISEDTLAEELPRFWIAQVPNFVLAHHDRGVFGRIEIVDVREDLSKWELENQHNMKQFQCLVEKIISKAKKDGYGKLEVCYGDNRTLELRTQAGNNEVLPPQLKAQWMKPNEEDTIAGGVKLPTETVEGANRPTFPDCQIYESDSDSELDYTACSAKGCGYCGRCSY